MATATLTQGTVKYGPCDPREYNGRWRVNAVVTLANGSDVKVWGDPDGPESRLQKGQHVQILQGRGRNGPTYSLVQPLDETQSQKQSQPQYQNGSGNGETQQQNEEDDEEKFKRLLKQSASRYGSAIRAAKFVVKNELGDLLGLDPKNPQLPQTPEALELVRCISSSLFIESHKGM